jgi:hypothetical protein
MAQNESNTSVLMQTFTASGVDRRIIDHDPIIDVVCNPTCITATLRLSKRPDQYGEVEYLVQMRGTNVAHRYVLKLVFSAPTLLIVDENQENTYFPLFLSSVWSPVVPEQGIPPVYSYPCDWEVHEDKNTENLVYELASEKSLQVLQIFKVSLLSGEKELFMNTPHIALDTNGTGHLDFELRPFANGNSTILVNSSRLGDAALVPYLGHGGALRLTVIVRPINQRPSFSMVQNITVLRDEYSTHPYRSGSDVMLISTGGPIDEESQSITFFVVPAPGSDGTAGFLLPPRIHPNGTLEFQTAQYWFFPDGAAFEVTLLDSGGSFHAGINSSLTVLLKIYIDLVNYAPSFSTLADTFTIGELDAARGINLQVANDISTGAPIGPETAQALTFDMYCSSTGSLTILDDTKLLSNGTLFFHTASGTFGQGSCSIVLRDDGGVENGGDDTSEVQTIALMVEAQNEAPSYELARSVVSVIEAQVTSAATITVPGIAHGMHPGNEELDQAMTFSLVLVSSKVAPTKT